MRSGEPKPKPKPQPSASPTASPPWLTRAHAHAHALSSQTLTSPYPPPPHPSPLARQETTDTIFHLNLVCTAIFIVESLLKVTALSLFGYLADWWNAFDFAVVLISAFDASMVLLAKSATFDSSPVQPSFLRILRIMRVLRTMRAIKTFTGIRRLLTTLFTSLPALMNVLSVFLLVEFTYSVLGMHLFRHVKWTDPNADFCTFSAAFLTMFRCATGENWNTLMHNAMVPSEQCTAEELKGGACGSWVAVPFFVSHTVLASFVVLKMIVALIIQNFVSSLRLERSRVQHRHAEAFLRSWGAYDPYGKGRISLAHLFDVIQGLPPPLGLDPGTFDQRRIRDVDLSRFILSLGLCAYRARAGGAPYVLFHEVLSSLLDRAFGDVLKSMRSAAMEGRVLEAVSEQMHSRITQKAAQHLGENSPDEREVVSVADHYAVFVIQRRWRLKLSRQGQGGGAGERKPMAPYEA